MTDRWMTVDELRRFNGKSDSSRSIYVAVNGKIFDVTEKGAEFYGPGGSYEVFAGRDASRGLATMSMIVSDKYDDLINLTDSHRASLLHWEKQFTEKYKLVGLLKIQE